MTNQNKRNGLFSGLILGVLIGAGLVYYLTSTEEGQKVKSGLKKKGQKALDDLSKTILDLENKGSEFKKKAKQIQVELEKKTESFQKEVSGEAKGQLAQIEELRKRGRKATKKFFTKNGKSLSK